VLSVVRLAPAEGRDFAALAHGSAQREPYGKAAPRTWSERHTWHGPKGLGGVAGCFGSLRRGRARDKHHLASALVQAGSDHTADRADAEHDEAHGSGEPVNSWRANIAAVVCAAVRNGSPRMRLATLLGDVHFWIPLGVFAAGVALLRWLP